MTREQWEQVFDELRPPAGYEHTPRFNLWVHEYREQRLGYALWLQDELDELAAATLQECLGNGGFYPRRTYNGLCFQWDSAESYYPHPPWCGLPAQLWARLPPARLLPGRSRVLDIGRYRSRLEAEAAFQTTLERCGLWDLAVHHRRMCVSIPHHLESLVLS